MASVRVAEGTENYLIKLNCDYNISYEIQNNCLHIICCIFPTHNSKNTSLNEKISSVRGDFMSAKGLEPLTNGLKGRCSTIELRALTGG
jgi:hypothetical protein